MSTWFCPSYNHILEGLARGQIWQIEGDDSLAHGEGHPQIEQASLALTIPHDMHSVSVLDGLSIVAADAEPGRIVLIRVSWGPVDTPTL